LEGEILFDGQDVIDSANALRLRRRMAMVFQEPLLFRASVFDNVAYGLTLRRYDKNMIRKRVEAILRDVRLIDFANRRASELSGGEAQRVAFARALVLDPDVILLDEPFGSLDPLTKTGLKAELKQLLRKIGATVVYVTHDQVEAIEMADRIAVMEKGRILQVGTPNQIFYRPVDEFVAKFVGVETVVPGKVVKQEEGLAEVKVDATYFEAVSDIEVGIEVNVCVRPEDISIILPIDGEKTSVRNHFPGQIVEIAHYGAISKITLDCGFKMIAAITKRSLEDLGLKKGQQVLTGIKATAVHLIPKRV